jgi:tetratricopeptide (TPR) repeat protein
MRAGRSIAAILFSLLPLMAAPSMTFPEADEQLKQGKYVEVLEFALETLRHDPDSFPALYLLGAALHRGEGNLPLAQRRLEQAKRIAERRGGYSALSSDDQKMYIETLEGLMDICGESEQYKEQLQIIDLARLRLGQDWGYRSG